eukprot:TRINITY_DN22853_c0_g3_i1.p1 TRINITY_DN22853_c0_g3~~TRINITY_DN22853_c0_g3_i1.p1  ORF type:complete len:1007 (-),score=152.32 TRINITY_DN22853_c0_g3_i1:130-3150(-)
MADEPAFSVRILVEPWAFEFVWEDILRSILLEVLANGRPDWLALGWESERSLVETVQRDLDMASMGNVARGLPQSHAAMIVSMLGNLVACEAVEDRPGATAATAARRRPARVPRPRPRRSIMDVQRAQLLCSALGPVLRKQPQELHPDVLAVKYHGEAATDGVGGAGVTRAFLTQAGALIRDVRFGLLLPALQSHQQLSPFPGFLAPRAKDGVARQPDRWSRFLGRLLGMSVVHECPLGLTLVPSLCKQLLGQEADFEDMRLIPGMDYYYLHLRKWLMHRTTDLVPPVPSLERLSSEQLGAELAGLPAEMPSKIQLVFQALLLRIEEAAPSRCEWEEALDVAACLLREAKTTEQQRSVLDSVQKLLNFLIAEDATGCADGAQPSEDETENAGSVACSRGRVASDSSSQGAVEGSALRERINSDKSDASIHSATSEAERSELPEGLPRALLALHAALPETGGIKSAVTCQLAAKVTESLEQVLRAHDVFKDMPPLPAAQGKGYPEQPMSKKTQLPKKKRGGGARRAIRAAVRAGAHRAKVLDLEATPTDWHYSDSGYFTLSMQGHECVFSELNEYGIVSGMLQRNGPSESYEGEVHRIKDGEPVLHSIARVKVVFDDAGDYCVCNFKCNVDHPWSADITATRVPLPKPPSLHRQFSRPTMDTDLSQDNLPDFAKAVVAKVLAGNLPHVGDIAAEFHAVVPEETYNRLSQKVTLTLPFSEDWADVLNGKLQHIVEEDLSLLYVTDKDGIEVKCLFDKGEEAGHWSCEACTVHNENSISKCTVCGAPRAEAPRKYCKLEQSLFPLHVKFQGWRKVQSLISGFRVEVDAWKAKTVYRGSAGDREPIVKLWWEYVSGCEARNYEELRQLFQWCTGWASVPTTDWKFQISILDEPSQIEPGKERLPSMILCMTDDSSVANSGVKTPTLNLPRYADRWERQTPYGWVPFEPGVAFEPGVSFDCDQGRVTFTSAEEGTLDAADLSQSLRLVSAQTTLAQKMWWALCGGQNMDAL